MQEGHSREGAASAARCRRSGRGRPGRGAAGASRGRATTSSGGRAREGEESEVGGRGVARQGLHRGETRRYLQREHILQRLSLGTLPLEKERESKSIIPPSRRSPSRQPRPVRQPRAPPPPRRPLLLLPLLLPPLLLARPPRSRTRTLRVPFLPDNLDAADLERARERAADPRLERGREGGCRAFARAGEGRGEDGRRRGRRRCRGDGGG